MKYKFLSSNTPIFNRYIIKLRRNLIEPSFRWCFYSVTILYHKISYSSSFVGFIRQSWIPYFLMIPQGFAYHTSILQHPSISSIYANLCVSLLHIRLIPNLLAFEVSLKNAATFKALRKRMPQITSEDHALSTEII